MVEERQGTVHYDVRLEDGRLVKRHVDHMQTRTATSRDTAEEDTLEQIDIPSQPTPTPLPVQPDQPPVQELPRDQEPPRRSARLRRPPDRYGDLLSV